MITFLSVLAVLIVWFLLGFRIIREDENAVVVLLGRPRRVIKSGLRHTRWPFEYVRHFTTTLIELNFKRAGIITKEAEFQGKKYGEANIGVDTTMYFRWPEGDDLLTTVRIVGDPEDREKLKNLFEETVQDAFRTAGGGKTWREIVQDRRKFAGKVLKTLTDEPTDPMVQARLKNARLVITHLELPANLRDVIVKPEIARIEKLATITQKEAEKRGMELVGEGAAYTRRKLFEAIGKESIDIQKETLLTLREMAQGTSNVIFPIPTNILEALEDVFGKKKSGGGIDLKKFVMGLSEGKKRFLIRTLNEMLKEGGAK